MNGAPQKVAWYFPLIPPLRRLFATSKDAQLLHWHKEGRRNHDYLRHPADSAQWHLINFKYRNFFDDMRNLRFALNTVGMNPFGHMSSSHSVWPVLLSIYNLPPWLCKSTWWCQFSYQARINQAMTSMCISDPLWMIWKHSGHWVLSSTMSTRKYPSHYMACYFAL